jgi:hypothetical protein
MQEITFPSKRLKVLIERAQIKNKELQVKKGVNLHGLQEVTGNKEKSLCGKDREAVIEGGIILQQVRDPRVGSW